MNNIILIKPFIIFVANVLNELYFCKLNNYSREINNKIMKCPFKKNEIIWAKLKGFPWWPGKINSIKSTCSNQHTIMIEFFGDKTICVVPVIKLKPYQENYNLFSKSKRTTLQRAITLANKDIESSVIKHSTQEVKVNKLALITKIRNVLNNSIKNISKEEIVFSIMKKVNKLKSTQFSPDILNVSTYYLID